ncbi:MAG: HD domain-containing protein, partial [Solirubrobacterales bacterium]|nr:HD domain-containing protein [Solirubrobacterales bacterium]
MSTRRAVWGILGGAAAALGAISVRSQREQLEAARAAAVTAEQRERAALAEHDQLRSALSRRQEELVRRGQLIERLQRSRRAEREWNHELRAQLQRAQMSRGGLSDSADVRELVLEAAIELVGAEKGLLLSRQDTNADGALDLVCAHGWEGDPGDSAIAQRFAAEVIERDRIVREDQPAGDGGTADEEIENLVAIPLYLSDRFEGVIVCANRDGGFGELEDDVLLALGDHAGSALQAQRLQNELNQSYRAAVQMLAEVLEARDPLVHREADEAALLATMLCHRLELEERECEIVAAAALLRDLGLLAIPDHVVLKPGALSPEERSIVELHPRTGFRVLGRITALADVAATVLYHHECYDGSGYPAKLAGTAIPLPARVVAIADAYIAMTHERPHRPARTPEEALAELAAGAGTQFDPELTQTCLEPRRGTARPRLLQRVQSTGQLP